MVTENYRWSLGTLIWLPIALLLVAALVFLTARLIRTWIPEERDSAYGDAAPLIVFAWIAGAMAVGIAGFTLLGMWPYHGEYHQWRETAGTVEQIDSRVVSGGEGVVNERFVVTFAGGEQRSCDDTRCAQIKEGDELTLVCKRAWQWAGTHGYDCNYVSGRSTGAGENQ